MVWWIGAVFLGGALAPLVSRAAGRSAGWVLAVLPLALTAWLASGIPAAAAGDPLAFAHAWSPSFGVVLSFRLDGLALLFALLVAGIGALVVLYASGYMGDDPGVGRLYALVLFFMGSMLGVVTANNLLVLVVFWELTSLTSYLLIGYDHGAEKSRKAALQALLVTGTGGLALLPGILMLGAVGGSLEIDVLAARSADVLAHPWYPAIVALVLAGAFTKSAQVPFHFWLPSAMAAPTPVSAYLHSATMVKAGVFLLARLTPVLGGTLLWNGLLQAFGAVTMVVAGFLATQQTDLKRLLAYTTVSTLGMLTMLLGEGTPAAMKGAMVLVVAHGLYKGALFMIAGIVDHETGTRDVLHLRGLWRRMPITAAAAALAALSAGGLMPFFGFISKETVYAALLERPILLAAAVLTNAFGMLIALVVGWQTFFGERVRTPRAPHDPPVSMWVAPFVLGAAGLAFGVLSALPQELVAAAASATRGTPVEAKLGLWHGFEREALLALSLSAVTLVAGFLFYGVYPSFLALANRLAYVYRRGPTRWYELALDGSLAFARWQTRVLQNGYLRMYLLTIVATTLLCTGAALVWRAPAVGAVGLADVEAYEIVLVAMILAGALLAIRTSSRLTAITGLGLVGYGVALVFLLYGAPDLALTQFAIETLTVILFLLVLYRLPRFARMSSGVQRARDAVVATGFGVLVTLLVLAATPGPSPTRLAPFFAENSLALAYGRNVVNVILVDFRALDTLGEITVLSVAALGVVALLGLVPRGEGAD